jgi:hypothetical protein
VSINDWFASTFNSANDVIQMSDKEAGVIIGKSGFPYSFDGGYMYRGYAGMVTYTLKVYVKDFRFKVDVNDFGHKAINSYTVDYSLGPLTTSDSYSEKGLGNKISKGMMKTYTEKVWVDAKDKSVNQASAIFLLLEERVKNTTKDEFENW